MTMMMIHNPKLWSYYKPQAPFHRITATSNSHSRRRALSLFALTTTSISAALFLFSNSPPPIFASSSSTPLFVQLPDSGGVKALDIRVGVGNFPLHGDKVAIHYYGRLAAKQGWRFDSTYDHKDATGESIPFEFVLGSGKVISGIEAAVRSMKVGGVRRVIIPPSEGYQNQSQEPLPPNFLCSFLIGKGCLPQSSIQLDLPMEKDQH